MNIFCVICAFLLCCTHQYVEHQYVEHTDLITFDESSDVSVRNPHSIYHFTPSEKKSLLFANKSKYKKFNGVGYLIRTAGGYDYYESGRLEQHCYLDFGKDSVYSYYVYPEGPRSFYIKDGLIRKVRFDAGGIYKYFYKNNHLYEVCSCDDKGNLDRNNTTYYYWKGDRLMSIKSCRSYGNDVISFTYQDSPDIPECTNGYEIMEQTSEFQIEDVPFLICGYFGTLPTYRKCTLTFPGNNDKTSIESLQSATQDSRKYVVKYWSRDDKLEDAHVDSDEINVKMLQSIFPAKRDTLQCDAVMLSSNNWKAKDVNKVYMAGIIIIVGILSIFVMPMYCRTDRRNKEWVTDASDNVDR